jgi:hypothetical protein
LSTGNKRSRGFGGIWDVEEYDGEPNDLDRVKRRRSVGDALGNKENIKVRFRHCFNEPPSIGTLLTV